MLERRHNTYKQKIRLLELELDLVKKQVTDESHDVENMTDDKDKKAASEI